MSMKKKISGESFLIAVKKAKILRHLVWDKSNKFKILHFYIDFLNHKFDTEDKKNNISAPFRLSEKFHYSFSSIWTHNSGEYNFLCPKLINMAVML